MTTGTKIMVNILVLMWIVGGMGNVLFLGMNIAKWWEERTNRIKRAGRLISEAALKAKWGTEPRVITWSPLTPLLDKTRQPANLREARFLRFMEKRPEIYQRFSDGVFAILRTGKDSTSARKVLDEIRTAEDGGEELSMPDAVTAYLSRLWMERNPIYVGFLSVRSFGNGETSDEVDAFFPVDYEPTDLDNIIKH